MDEWGAVEAERRSLVEDLAGVPDARWDAQSLCEEWKVRDVVGHLLLGERGFGWRDGFLGLARNGWSFNRFVARDGITTGMADPAALLAELEEKASSREHPPMVNAAVMLGDTLCHAQDIRRPLGLEHHYSEEILKTVADLFKKVGFPLGAKKRIAGIRLVATDMHWETGSGPEATGPLEALIMVMAGRRMALADVTGPATATLGARLPGVTRQEAS